MPKNKKESFCCQLLIRYLLHTRAQLVIGGGGADESTAQRRLWLIEAVGELRLVESVTSGILLGLLHSTDAALQVYSLTLPQCFSRQQLLTATIFYFTKMAVLGTLGKLGCTETPAMAQAFELAVAGNASHGASSFKDAAATFLFAALENALADEKPVSHTLAVTKVKRVGFLSFFFFSFPRFFLFLSHQPICARLLDRF